MTPSTAMPTYIKRWCIENCFAKKAFLGGNHLLSLTLNAIQTMLSLAILSRLDTKLNNAGVAPCIPSLDGRRLRALWYFSGKYL
jgi:hypothetical protein